MVQTILRALAEDAQPLVFVCGRIARLGEQAVLHRATQEERAIVDVELAALDFDVAQSEGGMVDIITSLDGQLVEVRMELVP